MDGGEVVDGGKVVDGGEVVDGGSKRWRGKDCTFGGISQ
jgi:hypothetical protein